ncbi:hypothetical protein F0562_019092 [Nyssa sinensis]|uniref:Uncharacterized protein n=1 Tax=Nyssa sinensis TaxID=561372 RepID=A0A5J4ZAV3_9ASTE|nr:hypothetical protein F0562_019092 [Nyssa sinensis]
MGGGNQRAALAGASRNVSEVRSRFKTKTFEFFKDDEETATTAAATDSEDADGFTLLDSAEEFIPDQKVVVIKPDQTHNTSVTQSACPIGPSNTYFVETLMSSLFATISSFEASYLQLQTAHVPFDEDTIKTADRALVSHLQRSSHIRQLYRNFRKNPNFNAEFPIESCLEAQVQENQSKLRTLETAFNRLQSDIDVKDDEVLVLRQKLDDIQKTNSKLSKWLSINSNSNPKSLTDVLLTIRVFDKMLREACRALHKFTKLLIDLMKKAGWDLDLAANSVHPDIDYPKKDHNRYGLLQKLANSFNPVVEIFQVERGVDFSMVYMEDITRKGILPGKTRPKVGFAVVPGFKIGKTVIQSQVYLTGLKYTE